MLSHFFIPSHKNNFKAKLLQLTSIYMVLALLLGYHFFIKSPQVKEVKILGFASQLSTDELIRLTNVKRAENAVGEVTYNAVLSEAALQKGLDMLEDDYWAHVAPDGTEPWAFFLGEGYKYRYAGENLARDFSTESAAVEAWMASPTHKENLLSSKYKEIGIAVVEGDLDGKDTTIIVQLFGTRVDTIPSVPVASAETDTPVNPSPEPSAEPTVEPVAITKEPLTPKIAGTTPQVSPYSVTKLVSYGVLTVMIIALGIDSYIIGKHKITRKGGRVLAHASFFVMVIIIVWVAREGQII